MERRERMKAELNADSVRMVVRHYLPQVRSCYERALKQRQELRGLVEIRLRIEDSGEVSSTSVYRNTTDHEGLGKCLAVTVKRWRFPRPVGGAVEFVYPFVFNAGG
jgi:TonB family protein